MALQTTEEVAAALGVTPARIHQLVRKFGLKPLKQWGRLFFTASDRKALAKRKTRPGPDGAKKRA